jgi:hypothetical protein
VLSVHSTQYPALVLQSSPPDCDDCVQFAPVMQGLAHRGTHVLQTIPPSVPPSLQSALVEQAMQTLPLQWGVFPPQLAGERHCTQTPASGSQRGVALELAQSVLVEHGIGWTAASASVSAPAGPSGAGVPSESEWASRTVASPGTVTSGVFESGPASPSVK